MRSPCSARLGPLSLDLLAAVRHLTTSCSPHAPARLGEEWSGWLTMRSERISSFTLPMMGTRFQAMGEVHSAAMYATLPETTGRYGCVEGNRWSEMFGDRISCGRGDCRRVGSRSCSMRKVLPSFTLRSSSGCVGLFPGDGVGGWSNRAVEELNHIGVRSG